jgi:hypothetical protein
MDFVVVQVPTVSRNGKLFNPLLTLGLLSVITVGAYNLNDIGIILALGGATWGNFVIYLYVHGSFRGA